MKLLSHKEKQQVVIDYSNKYNLKVLVETGTYTGQMVEACLLQFDKIYSIELCEKLYNNALDKFKNCNNVYLLQGDSGIILKYVIDKLQCPALFWLDGHYSGGITVLGDKVTPIIEELTHIFNNIIVYNIILIDDARLFGTSNGYPNLQTIKDMAINHNYKYELNDDIIRLMV